MLNAQCLCGLSISANVCPACLSAAKQPFKMRAEQGETVIAVLGLPAVEAECARHGGLHQRPRDHAEPGG